MSAFEIYMLIKLDAIKDMVGLFFMPVYIVFILSVVCWLGSWVSYSIWSQGDDYSYPSKEEKESMLKKYVIFRSKVLRILLVSFVLWFPSLLVTYLLPSTKEMAIIYVVPKLMSNDSLMSLPGKLVDLSSEWIEEFRPENVKESLKRGEK